MSLCRILQRAARRPLRVPPLYQKNLSARPLCLPQPRRIHATCTRQDSSFTNILADENPPPVQVKSITNDGISLSDGLVIPSACIFLGGKVFLWDVPVSLWAGWTK